MGRRRAYRAIAVAIVMLVAVLELSATAAFALPASTYHSETDHYSFSPPDGWKRIPKGVVDTAFAGVPGVDLDRMIAFQDPADPPFGGPYLTVVEFPQPGQTVDEVLAAARAEPKEALSGVADFAPESSGKDESKGLVEFVAVLGGEKGSLRIMSAYFVGPQGVTQLNLYYNETRKSEQEETYRSLVDSFAYDPGFEYRPPTSASPETPSAGPSGSPTAAGGTIPEGLPTTAGSAPPAEPVDYSRIIIIVLALVGILAIFGSAALAAARRRDRPESDPAEARIAALIRGTTLPGARPVEPDVQRLPDPGPDVDTVTRPNPRTAGPAVRGTTPRTAPSPRPVRVSRPTPPPPMAPGLTEDTLPWKPGEANPRRRPGA